MAATFSTGSTPRLAGGRCSPPSRRSTPWPPWRSRNRWSAPPNATERCAGSFRPSWSTCGSGPEPAARPCSRRWRFFVTSTRPAGGSFPMTRRCRSRQSTGRLWSSRAVAQSIGDSMRPPWPPRCVIASGPAMCGSRARAPTGASRTICCPRTRSPPRPRPCRLESKWEAIWPNAPACWISGSLRFLGDWPRATWSV